MYMKLWKTGFARQAKPVPPLFPPIIGYPFAPSAKLLVKSPQRFANHPDG
jgi:hypothetical protein